MDNPYLRLFRAQGTAAFSMASFLARLPFSMVGIGIITMLSQINGTYGLAGATAATFVFTYALLGPQISRLVDRYGQSKVLPFAAAISVFGLIGLAVCTYMDVPDFLLFMFAALTGFMPSMSAMSRARWTTIFRNKPELQTAYALETVLDEISFIAGPPISVSLSVMVFPQAGVLLSAAALSTGVIAFVAQRQTEPSVVGSPIASVGLNMIRNGSIILLIVLMMAMGTVVGTIDMVSVAFAEQTGYPARASIVLSAYAVGSCLAGLAFGAAKMTLPLPRLLVIVGLATAVTTLPLAFANTIAMLAFAVFVAGLFFAPTLIVAMTLTEQLVPEHKLTEGLTWLLSGLSIGIAIGSVIAGQVVDSYGTRSGFAIAVAAGLIIVATVAWGYRSFSRNTTGRAK